MKTKKRRFSRVPRSVLYDKHIHHVSIIKFGIQKWRGAEQSVSKSGLLLPLSFVLTFSLCGKRQASPCTTDLYSTTLWNTVLLFYSRIIHSSIGHLDSFTKRDLRHINNNLLNAFVSKIRKKDTWLMITIFYFLK